ncbi:MAG: Wzz/FepE/Etk N-terminal domain-containing protein [Roseibacillus sp.]
METKKKSFIARRWWVFLLVGALVGPMLGVLGAVLVSYLMPRQYESTAVVQVTPSGAGASHGILESRQYFATQFEVITAVKTLAPVVEELDLVNHWSKTEQESVTLLKGAITVNQRTGTDLIEITMRYVDPILAQKIAGSVALSYQNRRNHEERRRADMMLEALDAEIEEQKGHVDKKRKALDAIVRTTGRPYFEGKSSEATPDDEMGDGSADYRKIRRDYESALALLQELKIKHSTERVGLRAPRVTVTIHEEPRENLRPVSPNVPFNLMLGVVGGGLGGVLIAILMMLFFAVFSIGGKD